MPIYIASLSKAFTAVSIMLLQQKGVLNYDDKASKYINLPEDLYQFDQALRNFKLIHKSNTDLMYTPPKLSGKQQSNYRFGWFIEESEGRKAGSHTGGLSGFRAVFWRDLQHNSCIIALTTHGDSFPLQDFLTDMKRTLQ